MAVPTLTANSPQAGAISWGAFNLSYNGRTYAIAPGYSLNKYVWWAYADGDGGSNLIPNGTGASGDNTNFSAFTYVPDPDAPGGVAFEVTGHPNLLLWSNNPNHVPWNPVGSPTVTPAPALHADGFAFAPAKVASNGAVWNRLEQNLQLVGGTPYRAIFYAQEGSSGSCWLDFRRHSDNSGATPSGPFGSVVASSAASGECDKLTQTLVGNGIWRIEVTFTPATSGSYGIGIGPDSYTVGDDITVLGVSLTAGEAVFSPTTDTPAFTAAPDTPIPIDAARDYLAALALEWVQKDGETATAPDYTLTVLCQDNDGNTTGTLTLESGTTAKSYAQLQDAIQATQWPAGTTQILPSVTITTADGSPATVRTAGWSLTRADGGMQASDTQPALTRDDMLLFINKNGTPVTVPSAQIVDGSIIATESIIGDAIAANTITGTKLIAGTISAREIAAGSIATNALQALAVTAETIAANAVAAGKIAAGAVTAVTIAAGAVTTDKLDALAVTADKVAAGAITAAKLSVSTLSAITANLGTVTAGIIRDAASKFVIDLAARTLSVFDDNNTLRVKLGALSSDYGAELYDANGKKRFSATDGALYLNGDSIESLKPTQAGADKTGDHQAQSSFIIHSATCNGGGNCYDYRAIIPAHDQGLEQNSTLEYDLWVDPASPSKANIGIDIGFSDGSSLRALTQTFGWGNLGQWVHVSIPIGSVAYGKVCRYYACVFEDDSAGRYKAKYANIYLTHNDGSVMYQIYGAGDTVDGAVASNVGGNAYYSDVSFYTSDTGVLAAVTGAYRLADGTRQAMVTVGSYGAGWHGMTLGWSADSSGNVTFTASAATLQIGSRQIHYNASSMTTAGAPGSSYTEYMYYDDPGFSGGSQTLHNLPNSPLDLTAADGRLFIGKFNFTIPSGGGGGGSGGAACPVVEAFVIRRGRDGEEYVRAGSVRVGDYLKLTTNQWGRVTYSERKPTRCVRVIGQCGESISCSRTAPLELAAGGSVLAPDAKGEAVSIRCHKPVLVDRIAQVEDIGSRDVQHITCENAFFWVGDSTTTFFGHHNMKPMP